MWRAISNNIAIGETLFKRHINGDAMCRFCGEVESIEDVLMVCQLTSYVWFEILGLRINKVGLSSLGNWLVEILQMSLRRGKRKKDILTTVSFVLWQLWKE